MKRLVRWAAACILFVGLQLFFTYKLLAPHIGGLKYSIAWHDRSTIYSDNGFEWRALTPYYAWPVLVIYSGALIVFGVTASVAVGRSIVRREREAIAQREAAVALQEEELRIAMAETERIRTASQNQVHAAREEMKRCRQEAAAEIAEANTRLQGSVNTNMGRQEQIQKLRARVKELEERVKELGGQVTMGHC